MGVPSIPTTEDSFHKDFPILSRKRRKQRHDISCDSFISKDERILSVVVDNPCAKGQ